MSQGYRNATLYLTFAGIEINSPHGLKSTFLFPYSVYQDGENVDKNFPIEVWVPTNSTNNNHAACYVAIDNAEVGQTYLVDGDIEIKDIKDEVTGSYYPTISIKPNAIYPTDGHRRINKVTLCGRALPATKKDGTPLYEVIKTKPNARGGSIWRTNILVEKAPAPNAPKNSDGYPITESVRFTLSASVDENGKGKSASLFPYLAGQQVTAVGNLNITEYQGKCYVAIYVGGADGFISGAGQRNQTPVVPRLIGDSSPTPSATMPSETDTF